MGAGILPVALYRGTLFLLLGKERNNLWSDFGGSANNKEEIFKTAIREGCEELNGFLGTEDELETMVRKNSIMQIGFEERQKKSKKLIYTTFLFNVKYDKNLPYYFNNVNKFAEIHLHDKVNNYHNGLFEKNEINWFTISELKEKKINLRPWYKPFIESVIKNEKMIISSIKENA
tara:strand:+ start:48 stop:572 length:525 start_codon:yes stop_codon:yes gene_type:complete